jgi:hypothetical protein
MGHKTGKRAATYDKRDLRFEHYRVGAAKEPLPALPKTFSYKGVEKKPWKMLGNDSYGDCVWAGAGHETMLWNASRGVDVGFDDKGALGDYAKVTHFDPKKPDSDQGTEVRVAMKYRKATGVVDAADARHKIGAYVALEPGNWGHVLEASYLFMVVGMGFAFPESAHDQFDAGKPWEVVAGPTPTEGHYVPLIGWDARHLQCITWGKVQLISRAFFEKYCDEAWAMLSPEMLAGDEAMNGFDLPQLKQDLTSL